jgi:hypothetical protein
VVPCGNPQPDLPGTDSFPVGVLKHLQWSYWAMSVPARWGLVGLASIASIAAIAGAMLAIAIPSGDAGMAWAGVLLLTAAVALAALGHLAWRRVDPVVRYLAHRELLAGPPPGAELPG